MRLLIIGNMNGQIGTASQMARNRGARVTHVPDARSALGTLRSGQGADLILIDVTHNVKELVQGLEEERISLPVIACGFHTNAEDAVRAIRAGAKEYIPFPPDEELIAAIIASIAEEPHTIICRSQSMKDVLKVAKQVALSDANILITGESGTGKEVVARFIHTHSKRKDSDLVSVNCAAIPESLMESELFGYEKGAFTGAVGRRIGKFEEASNSTLLLDEISEIDVKLQAKLLRVIQEKEIDRLGGLKPVKVNFRIIATSNRDLQQEVRNGNFRNDLYFRLNIIHLKLPPLRERREDVALFAEHFIDKYSHSNDIPVKPLSPAALAKLENYTWPGNVRELENTLHRAVLLSSGDTIESDAVILSEASSSGATPAYSQTVCVEPETGGGEGIIGRTIESVEQELIIGTLQRCFGNRTHAAHILGISIRTLRNKLKLYQDSGTEIPEPKDASKSALA